MTTWNISQNSLYPESRKPSYLRNIFVDNLDDVAHDGAPGEGHKNVMTQKRRVIVKLGQIKATGWAVESSAHH